MKDLKILAFMPTYSPFNEASHEGRRGYERLAQPEVLSRCGRAYSHKPWVYLDAIDSVRNIRPDIVLTVNDSRSTDSIRNHLDCHNRTPGGYRLVLGRERRGQWDLLNECIDGEDFDYVVYTSSDIIWKEDWVEEAIKEFKKDSRCMIIFPTVSAGADVDVPDQIATGVKDVDAYEVKPVGASGREVTAYARSIPCLNMYAAIFRAEFFKTYGGYPNVFRNCFTETFLPLLCKAMGGNMKVMPRGNCYHHNGVDRWQEGGTWYNFGKEQGVFLEKIKKYMAQEERVDVGFMKELLYV